MNLENQVSILKGKANNTIFQEEIVPMELKHLIQLAGLLLVIYVGILGYNHLFNSEDTLDHRLGKRAMEKMIENDRVFKGHVLNMKLVEPGVYNMQTDGLEDARSAGNIAFNAMSNLSMTKWEMQASRHIFTIYGYDGDVLIFEVTNTSYDEPIVTLHGPFEGEEYTPHFGPQTSAPPSIRRSTNEPALGNDDRSSLCGLA